MANPLVFLLKIMAPKSMAKLTMGEIGQRLEAKISLPKDLVSFITLIGN